MTTTTTPAGEAASLFFGDARACKAWLAELPVTQVAQSQSTLLDALRVFNRAAFEPLERLKSLELLRDRVAFMIGGERARQFARPLPLPPQDAAAWAQAKSVLEELEAGYRRCASEPSVEAHAALIAQRVIRCIGAQVVLHAIVYRAPEAGLATRLEQQFAAAEKAGIAADKVKDSLESEGAASSVTEAYARVLLMLAAPLEQMSHAQIAFTEALARMWARKVVVSGDEVDREGVAKSVRRRIRALQAGEDVTAMGFPAEAGAVDPLQALRLVAMGWCDPVARETPGEAPRQTSAGLVFGAAAIHLFLSGGKPFEPPDKERELSTQEKNDIAVFGRVTQRTQSMMAATPVPTVEGWDVVEEGAGWLRVKRRANATSGVAVGRLAAVRLGDAAPFFLGVTRALRDEADGLFMTVSLLPGRPEPAAVRAGKAPWAQGFVLPALEKLSVPMSLVVPAGVALRGRPVFFWNNGPVEGRVAEMLDRGSDFDRVTLG